VGVKCSKAITRSEITRGFRVSENLQIRKKGDESGKKNKGIYRWFGRHFSQVNPRGVGFKKTDGNIRFLKL